VALTATIYNFDIDLADNDRRVYESLALRVARHPSESDEFLVTRVLAYCLNYQEGLEFTGGISEPEDPAIRVIGATGNIELWIDIGNPTSKRVHKAAKSAKRVLIYTHKDALMLAKELTEEKVHRLAEIGLYSFDQKFLKALGASLDRDNQWAMTCNEGELYIGVGTESFQGAVVKHKMG